MKRVLIIGGYGNFGRFISTSLAKDDNLLIIVAGRSLSKAKKLAEKIKGEAIAMDIHTELLEGLKKTQPDIVIHTSGPFQNQSYKVAETCIEYGAHYIDLADGREFVSEISTLDTKAKKANVLVVSGASSVPCLTSALLDDYHQVFSSIESAHYGITTAQKTTRGLATTAAILSYTGKPFKTVINGKQKTVYGWQDLQTRKYTGLGRRCLGNCNVPDLALFPERYPDIKSIRFYAGLELPFIHVTLWALSWLVRIRLINNLAPLAPTLLKLSFLFDRLGTENSGFHMDLSGHDKKGEKKKISFELIARSGDGPYIPCIPAILIARKLASDDISQTGATPCIGIINKEEYLNALKDLDIDWCERKM